MNRHVAAFLLAPLFGPLVVAALAVPMMRDVPWLYCLGLIIAAVVSYAGVALLGLPVYVALRARRWTAFWIAPVAGMLAGVITSAAVIALLPLLVQSGVVSFMLAMLPQTGEVIIAPNVQLWSTSIDGPPTVPVVLGALPGALVGAALWLIGRPDRP